MFTGSRSKRSLLDVAFDNQRCTIPRNEVRTVTDRELVLRRLVAEEESCARVERCLSTFDVTSGTHSERLVHVQGTSVCREDIQLRTEDVS